MATKETKLPLDVENASFDHPQSPPSIQPTEASKRMWLFRELQFTN